MNSNRIVWMFMIAGGAIGGYVPLLWGDSYFSFASIIFNALGAILGIWIAFRLTH